MWKIVKQILISPFGSFAFVSGAFLFFIWLAVKAGSIIEKFKLVEKLESNLQAIKEDLTYVKANIEIFQQTNSRFAQSQSPINLNEAGNDVSKGIDAKKAIDHVWSKINSEIKALLKNLPDSNPYTIQKVCFDIGQKYSHFLSSEDMQKVKTYAFNQGHNLAEYDILFGIEIRNKYFKENNINVTEVDDHDPLKGNSQKNPNRQETLFVNFISSFLNQGRFLPT